jgi:Na+/citrate or Na+/malate symporter
LAHIQLLVGFYLLFPFPELEMSVIMKDSILRFKFIEHPSIMVLAVALITIAKIKSKKIEDVVKANKTIFSYFLVALVLIALRTPWDKIF